MLALHVAIHLLVLVILFGAIYWIRNSSEGSAASWLVILLAIDILWVTMLLTQLLVPVRVIYSSSRAVGAVAPTLWFVFTLYYTGQEAWLSRARRRGIVALTGGIWLCIITNPLHGLVFDGYTEKQEPFLHLVAQPTFLHWVIVGIVYVFAVGGLIVLFDFIFSTRHLSRTQAITIIAAGTVAMSTNMIAILPVGPAVGFDYSGVGTGIFGAAMGWALFNERLFRVAPVARDSIFESFADPLVAIDLNGGIVDFNTAASEFFPTIGDAVGEPLSTVEPALVTDDENEQFADEFTTEIDGETRSFRIDTSPIEAGNRQVGIVLHLREVTELESYAARLERRTEQLEVKTEQLEQFASSVSHDLRNPINVAKGRISIAKETGELDNLDTASDALDRGLETIDELLELARSGQTISDPEPVELDTVIEDAWAAVDTKAATLITDCDGRTVSADAGRLQGLFENLFRNAIEHVGNDVQLRIEADESSFFVADDGPGIPPEEREQVFDHGYTGADGTGLGLAKVESIALAHDWDVAVEESQQGGARFVFTNVSYL